MRGVISSVVVSVFLGSFTMAAGQLPPEIMMDRYLLRADRLMAEEDHKAALDVMREIVALQSEYDLTLPDDFHFKHAQAAALADLPEQALEAVVKYLAAAGRKGEHYVEALELMNTVQAAVSCKGWNAEEYFERVPLDQVTACLDTGVDLEARDDSGSTPLHRAAIHTENPAVVEVLLNAGADPMAQDGDGRTPLHRAASHNENLAVLEKLLAAGADLGVNTRDGSTPLQAAAASNGNPAVANTLIGAGAGLEARDDELGATPLYRAARDNPNPAVVDVFLEAGAATAVRNESKYTLLHLAAGYNENPAVVLALLAAGANTEAENDQHWWSGTGGDQTYTPLHMAARYNSNPAVIEALLEGGAYREARTDWEYTPLHQAAWNKNPAMVEVLLTAGANLEAQAELKYTPLHLAAGGNENPAVIEALLAAGADVNARDRSKRTPLHQAARNNENPAVIGALLAAGAAIRRRGTMRPAHRCRRPSMTTTAILPLGKLSAKPGTDKPNDRGQRSKPDGKPTPALDYSARLSESSAARRLRPQAGGPTKQ